MLKIIRSSHGGISFCKFSLCKIHPLIIPCKQIIPINIYTVMFFQAFSFTNWAYFGIGIWNLDFGNHLLF
ncbi:unnamed protein product, partial [Vitis vinifera]